MQRERRRRSGCIAPACFLADETRCNLEETPFSSLFPDNNGHESRFFQRKARHSHTLSVDLDPRRRNTFSVQIRGVVNCTEMSFVLNVNSVQCAFLLFLSV